MPRSIALAAMSLVLLFLAGSHDADAARGTTDLRIPSPGGSAPGTTLPLGSYVVAAAALANDDVKLEWPGADGLGDTVIDNASTTFNAPSQSIVLQGTASVDGSSFSAMLILDWNAPDPMPVISLGLNGAWDMADLNPAWSLDGAAFAIGSTRCSPGCPPRAVSASRPRARPTW